MAENRKYDIVVFGASGVTGKYVVEELSLYHNDLVWCVAGRDKKKLRGILQEVGEIVHKDLDQIRILEADADNEDSIAVMCQSTRVLVNVVGPYRFSGEKVVEQCVKQGTHYVDVCGEPQFLETIQMKYFHEAKEKGVYIVGSCGFDSIPCDLGFEVFRKTFTGDINSVETFVDIKTSPGSTINFATWQSAVHGVAHAQELKPLRKSLKKKVFTKDLPRPKYRLKDRGNLFKSDEVGGWCIPFIGSDRSVMTRTQMYNFMFKNERPVQVQTYCKPRSLIAAVATLVMGALFMFMAKFSMGCYLLEKFPELFSLGVFSRNPPKRELTSKDSFSVTFSVKYWSEKLEDPADQHTQPPNNKIVAILEGPDPGYITTAICIVNSALVILKEKEKLPLSGGVFTPGNAFADTSIMKRLEERGINFTVKEK